MTQDDNQSNNLSSLLDSLEASLPQLLEQAGEQVRQGIHELQSALPRLKHMAQGSANAEHLLNRRVKALKQAESILEQVLKSTENAVTEVFEEVEAIHSLLDKCAEQCKGQSFVVDGLLDIKERQMHILSALQFQDIVSQQTRAVQTLLERIERDLVGATTKEETTVSIDMTDGSFDPDASFDRDQAGADQSDIDKWIEEAGSDEKG